MGEVYEAYDMEVQGIGRGRGAIILMTDKGIRQVSALNGTDERLLQEKQFKDSIYEKGFCYIDRVVPNSDEELVTCDRYGNPFVCREYFQGGNAVRPISGIWGRQSSIWHSFIKPAGNSMRMREAVNMIKCRAISTEN